MNKEITHTYSRTQTVRRLGYTLSLLLATTAISACWKERPARIAPASAIYGQQSALMSTATAESPLEPSATLIPLTARPAIPVEVPTFPAPIATVELPAPTSEFVPPPPPVATVEVVQPIPTAVEPPPTLTLIPTDHPETPMPRLDISGFSLALDGISVPTHSVAGYIDASQGMPYSFANHHALYFGNPEAFTDREQGYIILAVSAALIKPGQVSNDKIAMIFRHPQFSSPLTGSKDVTLLVHSMNEDGDPIALPGEPLRLMYEQHASRVPTSQFIATSELGISGTLGLVANGVNYQLVPYAIGFLPGPSDNLDVIQPALDNSPDIYQK